MQVLAFVIRRIPPHRRQQCSLSSSTSLAKAALTRAVPMQACSQVSNLQAAARLSRDTLLALRARSWTRARAAGSTPATGMPTHQELMSAYGPDKGSSMCSALLSWHAHASSLCRSIMESQAWKDGKVSQGSWSRRAPGQCPGVDHLQSGFCGVSQARPAAWQTMPQSWSCSVSENGAHHHQISACAWLAACQHANCPKYRCGGCAG